MTSRPSPNAEPRRGNETIEQLIGMLAMDMRRKAVVSLLAGNDTQCFSTEQYQRAYERESRTPGWCWRLEDGLAKKHLLSTGLVREVKPGLWTVKE